jgi:hypothetical protein
VTNDYAFAGTNDIPVGAVHCSECKGKYHWRASTQSAAAIEHRPATPAWTDPS